MLISAVFSVSAQNNGNGFNTQTEEEILDAMAEDWIWTCEENSKRCVDGMDIFLLIPRKRSLRWLKSHLPEAYGSMK